MIKRFLVSSFLVLAFAGYAMAELPESEVAKLNGPVYTVSGAEKAGSADGIIPAWTGGITKGADGWYYEGKLKVPFSKFDPSKSGLRPDPFVDDKVLYSVTAQNMAQYADKLSPGVQALLMKYPSDVRLDVYPTRRSIGYSPEVIEGTLKSARTARLEKDGRALVGAKNGFPFPFPKSGLEAVWNQLVRWSASTEYFHFRAHIVNAAGRLIMTDDGYGTMEYPYWDPKSTRTDMIYMVYENVLGPPNRVGEGQLILFPTDKTKGQPAWQYLPGQRRVKLAPEVSFDGPMNVVAGMGTYDQGSMNQGSPERYNWKLLGKKALIVPYNEYKLTYWTKAAELFGPRFMKPEALRFEVHRVWVIEGTLKPTERHIYKKRVLYVDEDSWVCVLTEQYDMKDKLWRLGFLNWVVNYDVMAPFAVNDTGLDLVSQGYYMMMHTAETGGIRYIPSRPPKEWAPSILSGRGIR